MSFPKSQFNDSRQSTDRAWGGKLILLTLVLTVLEGAVRKWIFPGPNPLRYAAYFSKDIVFVMAGIVGVGNAGSVFRDRVKWVLGISALLILPFAVLNFRNSTPIGALLSLRAYVILPVCAYCAAGTIKSWRDVDRILMVVSILAILVALLGLVQFRLPAGHVLNRYDTEGATITSEYGHVRAVGTFSYIAGMASLAGVAAWAGACLFLTGGGTRRGFGAAAAVSGLICGLVSMSRSGVIPWLLILAISPLCFGRRKEVMYIGILVVIGLWFVGGTDRESAAELGVYDVALKRFDHSDSFWARLAYFVDDFTIGISSAPFGTGLGSGQPGGYAASGVQLDRHYCENEFGRIVMEVGILGFAAVLLIRIRAIWMVAAQLRLHPDRRLLALCAASLPFLALAGVTNLAFNHTVSSFFWAVVALVAGAIRLESQVP
jgi:hypothetical protein